MKILTQDEAKQELDPYQGRIVKAFEQAQTRLDNSDTTGFTKRTEANIIRDCTVHNLKRILQSDKSVRIIERNNATLFRFGSSIICRVKKLDKQYLASYNHTLESTNFVNQSDLFGGQYSLTNLHIGYTLDDFGIGLDNIIITCPINAGKSNHWIYSISGATINENTTTTLDFSDDGGEEIDERIRLKPDVRKDKSQNDRTGSGS